MKKWEYLKISIVLDVKIIEYYMINDELQDVSKIQPNGKKTRTIDILDDWGNQGWELVSNDVTTYIFKRPKD